MGDPHVDVIDDNGGALLFDGWFHFTPAHLLLPFIALQMYVHWLIWIAALWAVTFPGATWSLAILFRRAAVVGEGAGSRP